MEMFFNIYCITLIIILILFACVIGITIVVNGRGNVVYKINWKRVFGASFVISVLVYVIVLMYKAFV